MSLSSYLAKNYLTASKPTKKRKRKQPEGLIIADDEDDWKNTNKSEDDEPTPINSGSAEFRKAKNSWKTVGTDLAQQIIDSTSAEIKASQADDEPEVVKMGDGTHAGLQSAKSVAEQFSKRKREEAEAWKREGMKKNEETVYRDATGRRIDISLKRQEARREEEERKKKENEEKEAQKGDVQIAEKKRRREELDDAKFMTFARGIDDLDMNKEMKEVERWNDPAAQFLSQSKKKEKTYTGSAAPNRYGIRPGYRWDGVDRGNGWEGERFKGINRRIRNKDLGFAWEMDE